MHVHILTDSHSKLIELHPMFDEYDAVTTAVLGDGNESEDCDAIVVAANLRSSQNIRSLRACLSQMESVRKRVFIVDQKTHLIDAQAYALGATRIVQAPANPRELRRLIQPQRRAAGDLDLPEARDIASGAAITLASMFSVVMFGNRVDVGAVASAGDKIADSIAEFGLAAWLRTVRRHHEGTYQHCLLVTGIVADFGLSFGMARADLQRLSTAAMFHDIGKAAIPRAILTSQASSTARSGR